MADQMLIDEYLPHYDAVLAEHLVVDADPMTTWHAARELDFMTVQLRPHRPSRGRPQQVLGRRYQRRAAAARRDGGRRAIPASGRRVSRVIEGARHGGHDEPETGPAT